MSLTTPITGSSSVALGSTVTLSNATGGGTWSSSDTTIATIDPSLGTVTTVAVGQCFIIYTVGSNSTSIQFTVTSVLVLTNGVNFNNAYPALQNRVLWQSQGIVSDSQRYFEDFHPLADTNIISAIMPSTSTLSSTLANKQRSVVMEVLNGIFNDPQIIDAAKLCFYRTDVMLYPQPVANTNGFVGLRMLMAKGDYTVRFDSVELFFNQNVSFNLYLYNDFTLPPLAVIPVTALANQQVIIDLKQTVLQSYLTPGNKGGIRYFGYYQSDIGTAQAMYYPIAAEVFHPVKIWAYSAPTYTDGLGERNFQRNVIGANNLTYGLNVEVTVFKDATNNIIQNSHLFDELIGLKMAEKIVKDIIFNYRSNNVERILGAKAELNTLYAELGGVKGNEETPTIIGLKQQISREVYRVKQAFQPHFKTLIGIS